jgi:hypothetical protein
MTVFACVTCSALLLVGAASAPAAVTAPNPTSAPAPVVLQFAGGGNPLVGVSFGLAAVDAVPLQPGERRLAHVSPGRRAIQFTCPADMTAINRIEFDFAADHSYELVCGPGPGVSATIRESGC